MEDQREAQGANTEVEVLEGVSVLVRCKRGPAKTCHMNI